jgi:CBS domain-containing protein
MSEKDRAARRTPVSACQDRLSIEPLLLGPELDVLAAVHRAAEQPQTRVIGVVNQEGVLIGVLPIVRLAQSVVARVAPEAIMRGLSEVDDIASFSHSVEARTVGEAMVAPASVAMDATIDQAFRKMHGRHESGLHIVDDAGRPIGYLDLLELSLVYLDVLEIAATHADPAASSG